MTGNMGPSGLSAIVIRDEHATDIAAIHALTAAAFLDAPHTSHTEQFIVDALRAAGVLTLSLVAVVDDDIVGHVAVSPVVVSDGSAGWFGLGPISVTPRLQRRGVGSLLMRAATERLRERDAAGCVLLGNPAYYGRFGFVATPELVLEGVPPEYFLALPFGPSSAHGRVTYHPAFDATS